MNMGILKPEKLPFRIGTTSYIIPADILENLDFLAGWVDDVELVLFESHEYSNLPSKVEIKKMAKIAADNDMTFTVHLPLDAAPGAANENIRKKSVEKWLRVIDLTAALDPFAWIVHLEGLPEAAKDRRIWREQCLCSLSGICDSAGRPDLFCVETLSYDFDLAWPMVRETGCSVCMDVGHLVLNDYDVKKYFENWFATTRVLHVHGVNSLGKDHVGLDFMEKDILLYILSALEDDPGKSRVLTLEIFSRDDLKRSMRVINECFAIKRT